MAFRGQVLVNPVSGERFVFHTTAAESHGKLLEFDLVVEPPGRGPGIGHPPIPARPAPSRPGGPGTPGLRRPAGRRG
jgi:hypothetical protein